MDGVMAKQGSRIRELPGTVFKKAIWKCLECQPDLDTTAVEQAIHHAHKTGHKVKVQRTRVVTLQRTFVPGRPPRGATG